MAHPAVMQTPPPRYRVVERGRRLIVIDTHTGEPASRHAPAAPSAPSRPTGPVRTSFDGRATLLTHRLYDAKAPRTLTLDGQETRLIENLRTVAIGVAVTWVVAGVFFPILFALPLALANGQLRRRLRGATTRFLDRYDVASAG